MNEMCVMMPERFVFRWASRREGKDDEGEVKRNNAGRQRKEWHVQSCKVGVFVPVFIWNQDSKSSRPALYIVLSFTLLHCTVSEGAYAEVRFTILGDSAHSFPTLWPPHYNPKPCRPFRLTAAMGSVRPAFITPKPCPGVHPIACNKRLPTLLGGIGSSLESERIRHNN